MSWEIVKELHDRPEKPDRKKDKEARTSKIWTRNHVIAFDPTQTDAKLSNRRRNGFHEI
jgi:hypothetical protein